MSSSHEKKLTELNKQDFRASAWSDIFLLKDQLSEEENMIKETAANYAQDKLMTRVLDNNRNESFDKNIFREMGAIGLLGSTIKGYNCPGVSYVAYGLIAREIERVDSSYRSCMSVQSSLVMHPIYTFGSEDQKSRFLPKLASGEHVGAFGLTEPNHGSDPGSMETKAVETQGGYILNGSKTWITNSPIADILIIWAKDEHNILRGFIVERGFKGLETPVLDKINFLISASENVAITGVSGSGKSTLLHLMAGLEKPDHGKVELLGHPINSLSQNKISTIRNKHFGFIYQFHHLLPDFSAIENTVMPLIIRGSDLSTNFKKGVKLLNFLGLENRINHMPHELSGGERQRIAIARAIITKPDIILADEPTGNLDYKNAELVFDMFLEITKEIKTAIILVTHDNKLAKKMSKIYQLTEGKVRTR